MLSDPIIESSANLKFAPYNVTYPLLDEQAKAAGLDPKANKWDLIFDFTTKESGKNYEFLDPAEFQLIRKELEGHDEELEVVFPYSEKYGGTLSEEANDQARAGNHDDGMMAFNINVSAKEAAKLLEEKEQQEEATEEVHPNSDQQNDDFDMFVGGGGGGSAGAGDNSHYSAPVENNIKSASPQKEKPHVPQSDTWSTQ